MIPTDELRKIARARLKDADILLAEKRFDGAVYICGYAIELALKARICLTLKWSGYPSESREFKNYLSLKTHDLDVLLRLSGREERIKTLFLAEWSAVAGWDPSTRYNPVGTAMETDARQMISSAKILLGRI